MKVETIGDATLYLGDCNEVIKHVSYDGVVTDPPYGVSMKRGDSKVGEAIQGDREPPRIAWVSRRPAIVWGGNNFCDQLPRSTGWLIWDKTFPDCAKHSQAEIAWTNVVKTIRLHTEAYHGFMRQRDGWFHPTQKPPALMEWCLSFMPNQTTILDPFMGSGTTGIACATLGKKFIGIEIDPKYFDIACKRISAAQAQGRLFA